MNYKPKCNMLIFRCMRRKLFHSTCKSFNHSNRNSNSSLIESRTFPPGSTGIVDNSKITNPWVECKDPAGSNQVYFWNKETNETTPLGSPRPSHWIAITDPNAYPNKPALTYWWNPETNQTTALGAPRPSSLPAQFTGNNTFYQSTPQTLGQSMTSYFVIGVGVSLGFALVRVMLG